MTNNDDHAARRLRYWCAALRVTTYDDGPDRIAAADMAASIVDMERDLDRLRNDAQVTLADTDHASRLGYASVSDALDALDAASRLARRMLGPDPAAAPTPVPCAHPDPHSPRQCRRQQGHDGEHLDAVFDEIQRLKEDL